jgi:bifunctional non-homologous end joining protein LigD
MKPVGWRYESQRHSLAAKGISTGRGYFRTKEEERAMRERYEEYVASLSDEAKAELMEKLEGAEEEQFERRSRPHLGLPRREKEEFMALKSIRAVAADPMRPTDTDKPVKGWIAERKWDGSRVLAEVKGGKVLLMNRRGVVKNRVFPELEELKREVKGQAVLDGEVIVVRNSRDDFKALAEREHLKDAGKIAELRKKEPVRYVVFDILKKDGECLRGLPLRERKRILMQTVDNNGFVRHATETTPAEARRLGAEGIVYKNPESVYVLGRSKEWKKYKFRKENDVVVMGYTKGSGKRKGLIGALEIGVPGKSLGRVGTGFTADENKRLKRLVDRGVKPVIRVRYLKRGTRGAYREPVYLGLRNDIKAEDTHA